MRCCARASLKFDVQMAHVSPKMMCTGLQVCAYQGAAGVSVDVIRLDVD